MFRIDENSRSAFNTRVCSIGSMFDLNILAILIGSSFASIPARVDPITHNLLVTITARDFNDGNPFEVRLVNQLFPLLNLNLYRGPPEDETEVINLVSETTSVPVIGLVWRRVTNDAGFIGIGAGSNLVSNSGPINILTQAGSINRLLTLHARDFLNFQDSCEPNSIFHVPYRTTMEHSALVNVRFALQYTISEGAISRRLIGTEFACPVNLSGPDCAGINYMTIPEPLAIEIALLLTQYGAINNSRARNRLDNCDEEMVDRLPDILITFLNDSFESVGEIVQSPQDYIFLHMERNYCELRFDVHNGVSPFAMDPTALAGVNIRLERARISFGEPQSA